MLRLRLVWLIIFLESVCCINSKFNSQTELKESLEDIGTTCKGKQCLPKCCGINEYVNFENSSIICEPLNPEDYINGTDSEYIFLDLLNIPLYDSHYHNMKTNKNLSDVFSLKPGKFNDINEDDKENLCELEALDEINSFFNGYLSELLNVGTQIMTAFGPKAPYALLSQPMTHTIGGSLYLEYPNAYDRWTQLNRDNFCVDIDIDKIPKFWFVLPTNKSSDKKYYITGLIISSVFLIIVLLVYLVLPELRNLAGLVLMAYVFSLASAFISLANLQLGEFTEEGCIALSGVTYFFFLSSFCWMNILSFDIWWTFRGHAKAREINRRGTSFKFGMYCIYAWGVPMLMTIGLIVVNKMDLSDYPWIVTPKIPIHGCFLEGGQKLVYLYIPMLILIILNWIFYLMTAFNIWRLVRGIAILNSTHRSQKNRFMVYLKLSVIMGINWLLEVMSYYTPDLNIWSYTDTYNLFVGFFIFLIFICKPKIYRKLKARFMNSPIVHKFYPNSTSQEVTSTISTNPNGSDIKET